MVFLSGTSENPERAWNSDSWYNSKESFGWVQAHVRQADEEEWSGKLRQQDQQRWDQYREMV